MSDVYLKLVSDNTKTGPIPVSTMPRETCSDACPLKRNGCYGDNFPISLHWNKVSTGERGYTWKEYCQAISAFPEGQLWRHSQVGDLPGTGDAIDMVRLKRMVKANEGKRGFTYTHKPMVLDNVNAVFWANREGFTINLSANSLAHADELLALGIAPVTTILPVESPEKLTTPNGATVIVCPAQSRDDITCASCGLCQVRDRTVVVGFRAHGATKRKVQSVFFKGDAQ